MKTAQRPQYVPENSSTVLTKEEFPNQPLQKRLNRLVRFMMWCVLNFAVWPILRPIAKRLGLFDFLFVVYPGVDTDITSYAPLWFQRMFRNIFLLSVIGKISGDKGKKSGLVITISCGIEEFSSEGLNELAEKIQAFAKGISINSIALAGRIPSVFATNKISLETPFVKGEKGTVFTITETFLQVLSQEGISIEEPVGVIGLGYIGDKVLRRLGELGCTSIVGFDIRLKKTDVRKNIIRTNDPTLLLKCKVVIVLTPRGADAAQVIPYGAVILDDTHPQLPVECVRKIWKEGGKVYKAALELRGLRFYPRLPRYDPRWIPGCVAECLVINGGGLKSTSQGEFDQKGREIGLRPFLVSPKGEE